MLFSSEHRGTRARGARTAAAAALLVLTATACRPAESKDFRGHETSFSYPGSWKRVGRVSLNMPASSPIWNVSVGVEASNSITLAAYTVNALVTDENLERLEDGITDNIKTILSRSGSAIVGGPTETELDALPALRFEVVDDAGHAKSTLYVAYQENTEYYLNCLYTDDRAEEITDGCNQVIDSINLPS